MHVEQGLSYDVVDVFTHRAFSGNPLAVVHGTGGLADEQLQALAREFNLSETAFPTLPPDAAAPADRYALRIFTPVTELPFAGHPSVGAAWALRSRGLVSDDLQQDCAAGVVRVELGGPGELVWLTGARPHRGVPLDEQAVLAGVGLTRADLAGPTLVAGAGLDFGYLFVHPPAVDRVAVDLAALRRSYGGRTDLGGVVVVGWHGEAARVRVFSDDIGAAAEDPATGSAALGLGVALVAAGLVDGDAVTTFTIAQGEHVGRPSALHGEVTARGGGAVRCRVGGGVVPVARGTIAVPAVSSARIGRAG